MKGKACKIDFTVTDIHELNKALAFYFGQSAYITAADGGTLYHDVDINDDVICHLVELSKASHSGRLVDKLGAISAPACCLMHSFSDTDIELENSTLIFDQQSVECMHLIKLIYTQMAEYYFATNHVSVPNLIETRHLQTAGYFEKFPTQAMLTATLPLDPIQVKNFITHHQKEALSSLDFFSDKKYALNPVTCYHIYSNFSKLYNKYQNYRFTVEGKAHRYEGRNTENGRLIEFHMAEIVLVENESNQVQTNKLIEFYKELFLMLNIPIEFKTSSDAFFTIDAKLHAQLQERTLSKIELICTLDDKSLSIGSINTHHEYFVKRFGLGESGAITTKCTGIGLERLLIVLYSYHSNNAKELLTHVYSSLNKRHSDHRRTEFTGGAM